jgi:hypothetical protein
VYASGFNEEGFTVTNQGLQDLSTGDQVGITEIANDATSTLDLPTFYDSLSVNQISVNTQINLAGSVTGTPSWTDTTSYLDGTDKTTIGPFGGVLPALPTATTTQKGVIEIATTGEVTTGTSISLAVTPATLASAGYAPLAGPAFTGPVTIGLGSATAPAINFAGGDTNTGIWSPAADTLAFSTGGIERTRIDLNGNVRIGTANVNGRLSIGGDGTNVTVCSIFGRDVQNGENSELRLHNTSYVSGDDRYVAITAVGDVQGYNQNLVFKTGVGNSTPIREVARLTHNGYLRMAASAGGIQFNGDTAAANALNDYEEGTWTPTGISATGRYTKIGNLVTLYLCADQNNNNNNTNPVTGLPFIPNNPSIAGNGRYYALNTNGTTEMATGAALVVGSNLYLMPLITTLSAGTGARWFSVTVTYATGY